MDVEKENDALDNYEVKHIEENENIKELISSINATHKEIVAGSKSIRIRRHMPKKIRTTALKVAKELERADENTFEGVEEKLYPIVAAMCIDEPFTSAATWRHIDEKTGCIQDVLLMIISEVSATEDKIKSFRGKQ